MTGNTFKATRRASLSLAACISVICSTVGASAAYAEDFTKRFYLGAGVGVSRVDPQSPTPALTISDDNDTGAHIALGYDISRFLTLEAYGGTLGNAEVAFLGTDVGSVDYQFIGLSALGYLFNSRSGFVFGDDDTSGLFRREGASLYGRIGVGHLFNDSSNVSFDQDHPNHVAFGLGLEYGLASGFAFRTEVIAMDEDARYFNVGVLKRFGRVVESAPALVTAAAQIEPPQLAQALPETVAPISPPMVFFDTNSVDIAPEAAQRLAEFAGQMSGGNQMILVEGYTDSVASEAYNFELSERRALSVANYLVSQGVSRERLSTIGYGETRPFGNNDTEEGRAQNRRTELVVN